MMVFFKEHLLKLLLTFMPLFIAFCLASIFVSLSLIHFYWGLGGMWGKAASLPTKETGEKIIYPNMWECFAVAMALMGCGVFVLCIVNPSIFQMPSWLKVYGLWTLSILFILRAVGEFRYVGFFKKVTSTPFAKSDTQLYSPLCLAIGLLAIILRLLV